MISKMNKVTLLIYYKEYEAFLERLRSVGVVHIEERKSGVAENTETQELLAQSGRYSRIIKRLEGLAGKDKLPAMQGVDAGVLVDNAETLYTEIEQLKTALQVVEKDVAAMTPWGDFDFSLLDKLSVAGYKVNFFVTAARDFKEEWCSLYNAVTIAENSSKLHFVTVTRNDVAVDVDAETAKIPTASLSALEAEAQSILAEIAEKENKLVEFATKNLSTIAAGLVALNKKMEFSNVVLSGEKVSGDKLLLLQGWVPQDEQKALVDMLEKDSVFYEITKPKIGDNIPVKFKNDAFTRMYEVLTKMYGMPSGTDFDPTPIVAPFFSLFFAFCMGDSGYGLVLILLGFLLKKKLGKDMAGMMNLVITLGIFTTFIGALFGTFFGMSLLSEHSPIPQVLKEFIISGKINLFGAEYDKQMILALAIGVVHISIAMTVKAINTTVFFGFKEAISSWGWWLVVVGGTVVGTLSFLSVIPAEVSKWALIAIGGVGAVGIYLLNSFNRNVFMNIGAGLWDTYNMAAGLLGDILSYIRLFALGLAGGMLGQTFNTLALMVVEGQEGVGAVIGWIGFGLIIVFGHTLNIAMSCLSAFVHPLRLTFVEYFKNAGYDGKGVEYKPFNK
ncbi:MAG: ATPase V [Bacteroidaceae bacterium]|nr:ATPase V [Bacteroidaceae bacterium]